MAKEITCDRGNCQKHFAPITMMDVYYEVAESGRNENQHICVECITAADLPNVVCPVCSCPRNGIPISVQVRGFMAPAVVIAMKAKKAFLLSVARYTDEHIQN